MDLKFKGITSASLHVLAMIFMLSDHLWATMLPNQDWMTCVGRLAFPLFAFMIVEGYYHTSNLRRYMKRLLICAVISEIPFDLMYGSTFFYPFHQNVLWTFSLALAAIVFIEKAKKIANKWLAWPLVVAIVLLSYALGTVTMVDYYGAGVLTVLVFYFFHGRKWWCLLGQLVGMWYINVDLLGGFYYTFNLFGQEIDIVQQGLAMLALIPIWLYKGVQGYHAKWFKYACYAFYPVHMLIIYLLWRVIA